MAYFYRFIHHASAKLAPLYKLKTYHTTKAFCQHWTEQHNKAFGIAKLAIAKVTMLAHPVIGAQPELWCDALNITVGAVLVQL